MPKASRLVARMRTSGHARNSVSASFAAASTTCSQLSRTSSSLRERQELDQHVAQRSGRLVTHAEGRGDDVDQQRPVVQLAQLDQPHPVAEIRPRVARGPQRQPGLADPADPGQRHQPRRRQACCAPRTARCGDRRSWSAPTEGSRWCGEHRCVAARGARFAVRLRPQRHLVDREAVTRLQLLNLVTQFAERTAGRAGRAPSPSRRPRRRRRGCRSRADPAPTRWRCAGTARPSARRCGVRTRRDR